MLIIAAVTVQLCFIFWDMREAMENEYSIRLKEIMSQTGCDNDFQCCKTGIQNHCGAKLICGSHMLDCSQCDSSRCFRTEPQNCYYRISFASDIFCICPVHIYLVQNPDAFRKQPADRKKRSIPV
jgi:hypothetical protein